MARSTLPGTAEEVPTGLITGGVDTHLDVHVAAALDQIGGLLGTASFATTPAGYRKLLLWLQSFGPISQVGIEGTSSYGADLTRALQEADVSVVEVDRPNRQVRRREGKSDALDAIAAARSVLAGTALGAPKARAETLRASGFSPSSGSPRVKPGPKPSTRSAAWSAPDLREQLRALTITQTVAICAAYRPRSGSDVETVSKVALRVLARRVQHLDADIDELDTRRTALVSEVAPDLLKAFGVGPDTAATLLVCVGDNPERLHSEAAFARLCGVAPIPAGSGKTDGYHRLHRGGDRQANSALWRIVLVRMSTDPDTKAYVARRTQEGKQKKFIKRCLKRYVARELFQLLPQPPQPLTP